MSDHSPPQLRTQQELLSEAKEHFAAQQKKHNANVSDCLWMGVLLFFLYLPLAPFTLSLSFEGVWPYAPNALKEIVFFGGPPVFWCIKGNSWTQKLSSWLWRKRHADKTADQQRKTEHALMNNNWSDPILQHIWKNAPDFSVLTPEQLAELAEHIHTTPIALQKQWQHMLIENKPLRVLQQQYFLKQPTTVGSKNTDAVNADEMAQQEQKDHLLSSVVLGAIPVSPHTGAVVRALRESGCDHGRQTFHNS